MGGDERGSGLWTDSTVDFPVLFAPDFKESVAGQHFDQTNFSSTVAFLRKLPVFLMLLLLDEIDYEYRSSSLPPNPPPHAIVSALLDISSL